MNFPVFRLGTRKVQEKLQEENKIEPVKDEDKDKPEPGKSI
jgi:hypothetical protein